MLNLSMLFFTCAAISTIWFCSTDLDRCEISIDIKSLEPISSALVGLLQACRHIYNANKKIGILQIGCLETQFKGLLLGADEKQFLIPARKIKESIS